LLVAVSITTALLSPVSGTTATGAFAAMAGAPTTLRPKFSATETADPFETRTSRDCRSCTPVMKTPFAPAS
jgi:hypothetical protein